MCKCPKVALNRSNKLLQSSVAQGLLLKPQNWDRLQRLSGLISSFDKEKLKLRGQLPTQGHTSPRQNV